MNAFIDDGAGRSTETLSYGNRAPIRAIRGALLHISEIIRRTPVRVSGQEQPWRGWGGKSGVIGFADGL